MADENILPRDQNHVTTAGFENSLVTGDVRPGQIIVATGRIKVDSSGGGSGTVTDVSVASANGFAGTVATSTTTPVITLSTTVTGILKGNGTAISAATAGTDYTALAFKTIAVSGQSDIVADSAADTLTIVAGSNITLTTNAATDTLTIAASGGASGITIGTTTITSGTDTRILYDNAGVVGEYTLTGSGTVVVMATSPTLVTPILGVAAATSINKVAITAPATSATLTIANGKTLTASVTMTLQGGDASILSIAAGKTLTSSNTLTFTGTDSSSVAFGAGGTVLYTTSTIPLTVGTSTIASGTNTRILYDNSGVLGEYTITGSGTIVAMATAPTFVTSITTPSVLATANDSGALGASGTAFADLFLASGGVINWAANNANITHSTGILTVGAGEFRITSANVGTNADSVPTLSSTSTMTNKTLTSPTIQTSPVLAAATNLKFTVPTSDPSATGITTNEFNSGYSSTAIGDLVYLDSSATWQKADADASAATYSSMLGIALSVTASGAAANVLLQGFIYAGTAFPTFTIGAPVYMSATAGAVTQTAPVTTDSATRILGYAIHADKMYFNPSNDWITHV